MAEFKAHKHSVRMSPRKGRLVADLIRGKKVGEAVAILKNLESTCAEPILKTLDEIPEEIRAFTGDRRKTIKINVLAASTLITETIINYQKKH